MKPYPPQEPLSALGAAYAERALARSESAQGIEFDLGGDPYRTLTVFPAARPSGDVLVFFHGGGWTSGGKEWMYFMAPALNAQGVTFVSAGYRLAPQHLFPVGFDDAADVLAWVIEHAGGYGGDARRVFVGGHSSGGHLAALLGVTRRWREARGLGAMPLAGCLPVSGTYRFGEGSGLSMRPRFLRPPDSGTETAAGPLAQLDANGAQACPPFFVTWDSRDFPHLARQSQEFVDALRAAGVAADTEVLDDCDHFEASLACGEIAWAALAAGWMKHQGAARPSTSQGAAHLSTSQGAAHLSTSQGAARPSTGDVQ
jgi:acetyl esterase/lipase